MAKAFFGENYREKVAQNAKENEPRKEAIKAEVMQANPKPADISQEDYDRRVMEKVEEVFLARHG